MSGGNPKDFVGASKAPLSTISRPVLHEVGLGMLEGECQYWRHNYRAASVRAMVYLDAMDRHVSAWIGGQDIDPKSGLSHLVKAICCLMIVRDAQRYGSLIDDRPPAESNPNWIDELNEKALAIVKSTEHLQRGAFTEANRSEWGAMCAALDNGPIAKESQVVTADVLYIPKQGERVRVIEIAPFDDEPYHTAGQTYVSSSTPNAGENPETETYGWVCFASDDVHSGGTWCRVAPV